MRLSLATSSSCSGLPALQVDDVLCVLRFRNTVVCLFSNDARDLIKYLDQTCLLGLTSCTCVARKGDLLHKQSSFQV